MPQAMPRRLPAKKTKEKLRFFCLLITAYPLQFLLLNASPILDSAKVFYQNILPFYCARLVCLLPDFFLFFKVKATLRGLHKYVCKQTSA